MQRSSALVALYRVRARTLARVAAVSAGLALSACETPPEVTPVEDPGAAWVAHQARLEGLTRWTAVGRLAVRSPDDSWSVGLRWSQAGDDYLIRLNNALGQGLLEISGGPGGVEMRTADEETFSAPTADELVYRQAGWRMPVEGLRYWILGRTEPGVPVAALELDPGGRLQFLAQAGWQVRYLAYEDHDGVALPRRVVWENELLTARLALSRWRLED